MLKSLHADSDIQQQYRVSHQNAVIAFKKGDIKAAHLTCVDILNKDSSFQESYYLLALINIHVNQYVKASKLLKLAINIKDIPKYRVELAKSYSLLGISDAVIDIGKTIDIDQLTSFYELDTLGVTLSLVGLHQKALRCFERAIEKKTTPEVLYNYAVSAKFCGQYNEAKTALTHAIDLRPNYHQAHFAVADLTSGSAINKHISALKMMLDSHKQSGAELSLQATLHVSHALAKEYEKQEKYTAAFEVLLRAKQKKSAVMPYDRDADRRIFESLHNIIKSQKKRPTPRKNSDSQRPIFVVGMPRSGTTLVERILSSHSHVTPGGELEDFSLLLKQASQSTGNSVLDVDIFESKHNIDFASLAKAYLTRTAHIGENQGKFVDKLPFNFFYLPFIRQAFPDAKIVCLVRNPLDTCIGNFRQLFSISNPHYNYTQSLPDCAWFYQQFRRWIDVWSEYDEAGTKLVEYELLSKDPEMHARELVSFCGLDWQQQCLQIESNTAPVSTASKMQVREPINQKSIGRWKRYRPYTTELESIFNDPSSCVK
jgi:tetratricopeptide (TPR) repeat protein